MQLKCLQTYATVFGIGLLLGVCGCEKPATVAPQELAVAPQSPTESGSLPVASDASAAPSVAATPMTPTSPPEVVALLDKLHSEKKTKDELPGYIASIPLPGKVAYTKTPEGALDRVDLAYTPVTNEDLLTLAKSPTIRELNLTNTGITDDGIVHLKEFPSLESVSLYGSPITDASIELFMEMPKLKFAGLNTTGITKEGMERLQQSRTDLTVQ